MTKRLSAMAAFITSLVISITGMSPVEATVGDPPPGGYNWVLMAEKKEYVTTADGYCWMRLHTARYPAPDNRWIRYKWSVSCNNGHFILRINEPLLLRENKTVFYRSNKQCYYASSCVVAVDKWDPVGEQEYLMSMTVDMVNPNGMGGLGRKFIR